MILSSFFKAWIKMLIIIMLVNWRSNPFPCTFSIFEEKIFMKIHKMKLFLKKRVKPEV